MVVASMEARIDQVCESIDRLVSTEMEARPGESRGKIHLLYQAARERLGRRLAQAAAEALIEAARGGGPVLVSNGWVIDFWYPNGEICGMVGSVALSRAITQGLGVQVCFLTEEPVLPVFQAVSRAAGIRVFQADALPDLPSVVAARSFPINPEAARTEATSLLDRMKPSAVITLEKCSPNEKGVYHSGRGTDMSATTAKVDVVVTEARQRGILTIGIGDLGNEIGLGNIRDVVREHIPYGAECSCGCGGGMAAAVETDYLIVASSSSRGGYGLEAALATLLGNPGLMHDGQTEKRMILAASGAGAIDSFTVGPTPTDGHGVDAQVSACLVELLRHVVQTRDTAFSMYAARK